jgi:hypothetical protein
MNSHAIKIPLNSRVAALIESKLHSPQWADGVNMRNFILWTMAASGLAIGLSTAVAAAPTMHPSHPGATLPALAADRADYTWVSAQLPAHGKH